MTTPHASFPQTRNGAIDRLERALPELSANLAVEPSQLLVTPEDMDPESLFPEGGPIAAVIVAGDGIALAQVRRRWDAQFWAHAKKGCFAFKERIPETLRADGLPA
jgi:hypothetical protein